MSALATRAGPRRYRSVMKNSIRKIDGNWDLGYVLDKHALSSVYTGDNAQGHPQFDTIRSEVGEALFQLKYRRDWKQIPIIATELAGSLYPRYKDVELLIPMPASNFRARQPVTELTQALGKLVQIPVFENLLHKKRNGKQLKNLTTKAEKARRFKTVSASTTGSAVRRHGMRSSLMISSPPAPRWKPHALPCAHIQKCEKYMSRR